MSGLDGKGTKFPNGINVNAGELFIDSVAVTANATELNLIDGTDRIRKIAKVALGVADTAGGVLSWQNPEGADIVITRLVVDVTTASTAACTMDFGTTATNGTTTSDNLIDGVDTNTAVIIADNITNKGTNGKSVLKLAAGKWVTGSKATGAAAGTAGFAYIEYFVI